MLPGRVEVRWIGMFQRGERRKPRQAEQMRARPWQGKGSGEGGGEGGGKGLRVWSRVCGVGCGARTMGWRVRVRHNAAR